MAKKKNDGNSINDLLGGELFTMDSGYSADIERIPTNITRLDAALGGGMPVGKIVELFGGPNSGKSATALRLAGQAQQFGKVVYIDLENTLDPAKALNSGIDTSELLIAQPSSTEKTFELLLQIAHTDDVPLVVVDSVAAMVSEAELNGDMGDSHVGVTGRLMSQGLRKLNQIMTERDSKLIVVFINQVRDNIGVMGFGPKTVTTGGKALKFWSSVRIEVSYVGRWKQGEEIIGQDAVAKVVKNKYDPPFRSAKFSLHYVHGICNERPLIEDAVADGRLKKSGSWFKLADGTSLAQGEIALIELLRENPDLLGVVDV